MKKISKRLLIRDITKLAHYAKDKMKALDRNSSIFALSNCYYNGYLQAIHIILLELENYYD